MRIAVVDDDLQLSEAIARGLRKHQFDVVTARTMADARELLLFASRDVIARRTMRASGAA